MPSGNIIHWLIAATLLTCASACTSSRQPSVATVAEATALEKSEERMSAPTPSTKPATRPFMIGEARLPGGFPPPGPVGVVMVKEYPAYRAARVTSKELKDADMNGMFRPLFNHIKSNQIAMTAPVEMTYDATDADKPEAMAFLYGDPAMGEIGREGLVNVIDLPAVTVASVAVRGSYNDRNFEKGMKQLEAWLIENAATCEHAGSPRFLGYNSPFVPWFLRLGEVQMPIRMKPIGS